MINNEVQTTSIFVPVEVPIKIPNSIEQNFTKEELDFLKKKGKYNDEEFVCGEKVWELFCDIIENKDADFTKQKEHQIIMQGLISKFSFSVSTYSRSTQNILKSTMGIEEYGFYRLTHPEKIYDYKTGIKTMEFKDEHFM